MSGSTGHGEDDNCAGHFGGPFSVQGLVSLLFACLSKDHVVENRTGRPLEDSGEGDEDEESADWLCLHLVRRWTGNGSHCCGHRPHGSSPTMCHSATGTGKRPVDGYPLAKPRPIGEHAVRLRVKQKAVQ